MLIINTIPTLGQVHITRIWSVLDSSAQLNTLMSHDLATTRIDQAIYKTTHTHRGC